MARLLANENIPLASVFRLRGAGHDVAAIAEDSPGVADEVVLDRARIERRVVVTFDRDYGELVFRRPRGPIEGVLYLRFEPAYPEEPAELVLRMLTEHGIDLSRHFTVLDRAHVRQRRLT